MQNKMRYTDLDIYNDVDIDNVASNSPQFKLLKLSKNAKHVTMHYSTHFADENDPWLVLDELINFSSAWKIH